MPPRKRKSERLQELQKAVETKRGRSATTTYDVDTQPNPSTSSEAVSMAPIATPSQDTGHEPNAATSTPANHTTSQTVPPAIIQAPVRDSAPPLSSGVQSAISHMNNTNVDSVSGCQCHDTWVTFNYSCYLFGHGNGLHFTEAEHYCRQHKSHIVKIDSAEENSFLKGYIMSLVGERYWIGLTDEEVEGLWKWAGTDERMTFTDWNPGEPNSWDELEDCVGIAKDDQGRWFDIGCDSMYLTICETSANVTDPTIILG